MSVPSSFADLGKSARDLFSKGFNYGQVKLETKTVTQQGLEVKVNGSSNSDTGAVSGSLETKTKMADYGATLIHKLTSDHVICTEATVEDQLVDGMKITFDGTFAPTTGKRTGKIKTAYKRDYVHVNLDVDLNSLNIDGAVVLGYNNFLAGFKMGADSSKGVITKNNFAVGYSKGDFTLHSSVSDGNDFGASFYQRVNSDLEMGVDVAYNAGSNNSTFGLASKYCLDRDSTLRTKVNNSGQVGIGYTHNLKKGVTITMSALMNATNFGAGGHKLGVGLEFQA